ncbi:hypothetical protein J4E90_005255 [Alternaria incomplexa]|uniref:uncharacterized protein n=1 Tax=Alternaria incomplexa TaxID=1187928 RepID=UPI00221F9FD0|nr:uncharacterized protein J4E90_005255 [Alternaria incomplexa]XP_051307849.1 uncharacterized protein J4E86_001108 [Alternaria arbusti]KAI4913538.1 hypothetical protein J4E90_005255 [Alternaria incomplexa]KAI4962076.1 hypothetical protein J4E86_001108 [Alternaria arbusti]
MMVTVAANNKFQFTPNSIVAQPGDMVAFNFVSQNHSVASSDANSPCQPQANAIFSDFQPIPGNPNGSPGAGGAGGAGNAAGAAAAANGNGKGNGRNRNNNRQAGNTPMFMVPVVDNQPMYIYCSQAQHCQQGMVMVINPPNAQAVTQYQNLAAQANNNVSPQGGISGGQVVNNLAGTTPKSVLGGTAGDAATAAKAATNGNGKGKGGGAAGGGLAGFLAGLGKNNVVVETSSKKLFGFPGAGALGGGGAAAALAGAGAGAGGAGGAGAAAGGGGAGAIAKSGLKGFLNGLAQGAN